MNKFRVFVFTALGQCSRYQMLIGSHYKAWIEMPGMFGQSSGWDGSLDVIGIMQVGWRELLSEKCNILLNKFSKMLLSFGCSKLES